MGYLDENRHLFIHKRQCPVATRLKSSFGNRILATAWDEKYNNIFPIIIYIKGIDSLGLLSDITEVFSKKLNINIRDIKFNTEDGIFEGRVKVNVQNVDDVNQIYTELKKIPSIKQVSRIEEE